MVSSNKMTGVVIKEQTSQVGLLLHWSVSRIGICYVTLYILIYLFTYVTIISQLPTKITAMLYFLLSKTATSAQ